MSTKNQLPSDTPIGSSLDEIAARRSPLEQNPRRLITGAVIALVFGIGISVIFVTKNQKAKAAGEAFGSASTTEELQAVVENHPGSAAAGSALVSIAANHADDAKYDEAVTTIDRFVSEFPEHELVAQALLAKATIQMTQKDTDGALATIDTFEASHGTSALAPFVAITRGDVLKAAGRIDEAKAAYENIPTEDQAIDALVDQRLQFINFTSPIEIEPAPEPVTEPAPATNIEVQPIEPAPAEKAAPIVEPAPVEEAAPAEEIDPIVEPRPIEEAAPAEGAEAAAQEATE